MKKILITIIVAGISLSLAAQKMHTVAWYNWSNPITYQLSPSPYITGYGYYSDSLSNANDGVTFYEYNGEYYPVKSWADYYLWYVNEYWFHFIDPELYEYYYMTKNDFEMARYIAGRSYLGRYYPSRICISFVNKEVEINRLHDGSRYIASNDKQVKKLKRLENLAKEPYKNHHYLAAKNNIVKKPNNTSKNDNNEVTTSGKNYRQKIIKKEVKLNKYKHVNFRSNTNYRKSSGNTTNTSSRSSSYVKNNSSNTKLPKQK